MSIFLDSNQTTPAERQEIAAAWLLTYGRARAIRLAKELACATGGALDDKHTYRAVAQIIEDTPEGK